MDFFFPFIYETEKKENELQSLYIELIPPCKKEKEEKREEESNIIIEL